MPYEKMQSNLKALREEKGISANELAKEIGVSRHTIRNLETGRHIPNVFLALELSDYLEVPVWELFIDKRI